MKKAWPCRDKEIRVTSAQIVTAWVWEPISREPVGISTIHKPLLMARLRSNNAGGNENWKTTGVDPTKELFRQEKWMKWLKRSTPPKWLFVWKTPSRKNSIHKTSL